MLQALEPEPGTVDWRAYSLCVLEQFHRCLGRRELFAVNSSKWGDPRGKLLAGENERRRSGTPSHRPSV